MKKELIEFAKKTSTVIAAFAIFFASVAANTTCGFIVYQSELPKQVDALRKFK